MGRLSRSRACAHHHVRHGSFLHAAQLQQWVFVSNDRSHSSEYLNPLAKQKPQFYRDVRTAPRCAQASS